MRGKVGRNEHILLAIIWTCWKIWFSRTMTSQKVKVFKKSKIFCPSSVRKLDQHIWNYIFQTLIHFFCYLLIFVKKVLKATIFELNKTILLISSLTLKNMSNRFFVLFTLFFFIFFFKTRFFRDSWGVNSALSQIMHIFCKKMQRNRLLKLTQSHL